jgi:MoaA/NifB/PqqE/SkfB family radical SAM enzyme
MGTLGYRLIKGARNIRWGMRRGFALLQPHKFVRLAFLNVVRRNSVRLRSRRSEFAPPPLRATLRLTHSCNLRCLPCAQWGEKGVFRRAGERLSSKELSTEDWKDVIGEIAAFCPHIYFFGGEPLLRKDCLDIVSYASSKGSYVGINSNGTLLAGKGNDLIDSGLDYIIVSLDGTPEINNRIRLGKEDSARAVLAGAKELIQSKMKRRSITPIVELLMTVSSENAAGILDAAKQAKALDVDLFAISLGIFTTEPLAQESQRQFVADFGLEPEFFSGFVRDVARLPLLEIEKQIAHARRLWGSRFKQYPLPKVDIFSYFLEPERPLIPRPCRVPWLMMQIFPDGDLVFCSDFADLRAGNVRHEGALTAWNGPLSRAFRRRILERGIFPAEARCCDYYLH